MREIQIGTDMLEHVDEEWSQDWVGVPIEVGVSGAVLADLHGGVLQGLHFEIPLVVEETQQIHLVSSFVDPAVLDVCAVDRIRDERSI